MEMLKDKRVLIGGAVVLLLLIVVLAAMLMRCQKKRKEDEKKDGFAGPSAPNPYAPIDCIPGPWNHADNDPAFQCTTKCGSPDYHITRFRTIKSPEVNGGKKCDLIDSKYCPPTRPCPK